MGGSSDVPVRTHGIQLSSDVCGVLLTGGGLTLMAPALTAREHSYDEARPSWHVTGRDRSRTGEVLGSRPGLPANPHRHPAPPHARCHGEFPLGMP